MQYINLKAGMNNGNIQVTLKTNVSQVYLKSDKLQDSSLYSLQRHNVILQHTCEPDCTFVMRYHQCWLQNRRCTS